jgi:hypothetical protein
MNDENRLIHDYLAGEATDDDRRRLEAWMKQDASHVDLFVREAALHRALHEACREMVPMSSDAHEDSTPPTSPSPPPIACVGLPDVAPVDDTGMTADSDATGGTSVFHVWPGGLQRWFLSGLLLLLLAGVGGWFLVNRERAASPGGDPAILAHSPREPVATIEEIAQCEWAKSLTGSNKPGPRVSPGDILNLRHGTANVHFDCGATVKLEAPALLEIDTNMDATLLTGKLLVNVPEIARGFLVHTGDMVVRDLGTEFALHVDESGETRVDVVEGEVEASLPQKDANPKATHSLGMGEFLRTGRTVPGAEPDSQRLSVFRGVRLNFATPDALKLLTIINENKDHYRLDPLSGCLAVDTTWGNVWGRRPPGENLFVLPAPRNADFDVVLSVASFAAERFCEHVGLLILNDRDNYARIIYARHHIQQRRYVQFNVETNGNPGSRAFEPIEFGPEPFQLRLVRRGSEVSGWWSRDGKQWILRDRGRVPDPVRYVGFYASKGHPYPKDGTPCRQALIERFEIEVQEMNRHLDPGNVSQ